MSVEHLCEHRTKLCAMKAALLGGNRSSYDAYKLDDDLKRLDRLIEQAIANDRLINLPVIRPSIYNRKRLMPSNDSTGEES